MSKVYTMREIWDIIEDWLAANTPWIYESLAPPATDDEIREAEVALGLTFPDDLRESYRIHNGQKPWRPFIDVQGTGFLYGDCLQTLAWVVRNGEVQQKYAMVSGLKYLRHVVGPIKQELNN